VSGAAAAARGLAAGVRSSGGRIIGRVGCVVAVAVLCGCCRVAGISGVAGLFRLVHCAIAVVVHIIVRQLWRARVDVRI
jgi:hypothetical protein